jgi:glycosyltransferase involved in cell wall biosynthesis
LKLVVLHYHLRPGGIRRVIEVALPELAWQLGAQQVVICSGEPPAQRDWSMRLEKRLAPVPVEVVTNRSLLYAAEQKTAPERLRQTIRSFFARVLKECQHGQGVVWAHNLSVGRNVVLAEEISRFCHVHKIVLVLHHHDWWCDNRWGRWREIQQSGAETLSRVARALLPPVRNVRHIAINRADAGVLSRHLGRRAVWIPNPTQAFPKIDPERRRYARSWLTKHLPHEAAVWLLPVRVLRRKNLGEALLLMRWLRPGAWLVTTAGASSADELPYARALIGGARRNGWPLRVGILRRAGQSGPSVAELLSVSEAVMLTSIQEGFGLPFIEAAAAGRPLIARAVPNVMPDLHHLGFRLPHVYAETWVHPDLIPWDSERERQARLFAAFRAQLPSAARSHLERPMLLSMGSMRGPLPFSRLTMTGQLEVLAQPTEKSWALCAPLNPWLEHWREQAVTGKLRAIPWPANTEKTMGCTAFALRLQRLLREEAPAPKAKASVVAQTELMSLKLKTEWQFPLLWSPKT